MKPLSLDQQIQIARVFGWISCVIEGDANKFAQHEAVRRAAAAVCPILRLDGERPIDDLWELAGLPENGLDGDKDRDWFETLLPGLAEPLRREP